MSLKIVRVDNASTPEMEIVWMTATANINLKGYAIVDRTFDEGEKVSNEFRHIFIFPAIEVKKDEWVKVCTGKGDYKKVTNDSGVVFHRFFWQSDECVWNNNGKDKVSIIKYTQVDSMKVPAV